MAENERASCDPENKSVPELPLGTALRKVGDGGAGAEKLALDDDVANADEPVLARLFAPL